jgi:hypothetical protein
MPESKRIDAIIQTISAIRPKGDDYLEQLEELCDEIESLPDGKKAMNPLFALLEKYPNVDFGAPGPVVHLLETYYKKGYEEALLASLARRPVPLTVWMLNRLINGSSGKAKASYLEVMQRLASNKDMPASIRRDAKEFLDSPDED